MIIDKGKLHRAKGVDPNMIATARKEGRCMRCTISLVCQTSPSPWAARAYVSDAYVKETGRLFNAAWDHAVRLMLCQYYEEPR